MNQGRENLEQSGSPFSQNKKDMEKIERKAYQNTIQQTSSEKLMQGDEANKFLDYLLSETNGIPVYQTDNPLNRCSGYFDDGKKWIAFYNLSGSCWVEEFDTEDEAKNYVDDTKSD